MKLLEGKIALITGASRGIGRGIAKAFAAQGAAVAFTYLSSVEKGQALEAELAGEGIRAKGYRSDASDFDQAQALVDEVIKDFGRIDILVNNAGIQIRKWATEFPIEEFDKVINVNMRAYYIASRCAARYMQKQGGGSIVCISSGNSQCFTSQRSAYNISKAAVNGLVATLGVEWARFNIRINAVAPGYVMTEMIQKGINEGIIDIDNIMKVIPMKRLLMPEEIGNSVVFLASDEASGITGQTLFTDGGWSKAGLPEEKDM